MFTGIITDVGTVTKHDAAGGDLTLTIHTSYDNAGIKIGESIACNGCCLTVVEKGADNSGNYFTVQLSKETLDCTARQWNEGAKINLERALKMGDDISGHLVTGHVDTVAKITNIEKVGDSHKLNIEVDVDIAKFIAPKGSVTLSGVSLTVNEVKGNQFSVNIIPHTWDHTSFSSLETGGELNLEVDLLARYVARLMGKDA